MAVAELIIEKLSNCKTDKKSCILKPDSKSLYQSFVSEVIDTVLLETRAVKNAEALNKMSSASKVKRFQEFYSAKTTQKAYGDRATVVGINGEFAKLDKTLAADSAIGEQTAKAALFVRLLLDKEKASLVRNSKTESIPVTSKADTKASVPAPSLPDAVRLNSTATGPSSSLPSLADLARSQIQKPKFNFSMKNELHQSVMVDVGDQETLNKLNELQKKVGEIGYTQMPNSMRTQLTVTHGGEAHIAVGITFAKAVNVLEMEIAASEKVSTIKQLVAEAPVTKRTDFPNTFRNRAGDLQEWPKNLSDEEKYLINRMAETASKVGLILYNDNGSFVLANPKDSKNTKVFNLTDSNPKVRSAMLDIMTDKIQLALQEQLKPPRN